MSIYRRTNIFPPKKFLLARWLNFKRVGISMKKKIYWKNGLSFGEKY